MSVPLLPLADRPRFAAKMIAVWRWHHMAQGEELTVTVMPGEWPEGVPREVKGCEVVEHASVGGAGGILILGRKGTKWYAAYQLAVAEDRSLKLWLSPDPDTGEVPMWQMTGGAQNR